MSSTEGQDSTHPKPSGPLPADPYADAIKLAGVAVPVVTYAIKDRDADVYAEKVKLSPWESDILIRTPLGRLQVRWKFATGAEWYAAWDVLRDW